MSTPDSPSGQETVDADEFSNREVTRVAPHAQLSSKGLAAAFGVMIAAGLGVYAMFPESVGGPPLPVEVQIDQAAVETISGGMAALTEVVSVSNGNDFPILNLTIELNDQFLLTHASPLKPGETLVFPQEVFTDKRSSKRFQPKLMDVKEVVVTGQLPSRSRGVSKFEFAD